MTDSTEHLPLHSRRRMLAALVSACLPLPLVAAEEGATPESLGLFRLVNAIGLPGKLKVRVDGINPRPSGFPAGEATAAIGLQPKSYQVELEHEALGTGTVMVTVATGMISTVIAYKTEKAAKDPKAAKSTKEKDEKAGPKLAWHVDQAPVSPPKLKEPKLTLMQLTTNEKMDFKIGGTLVSLASEKPSQIPVTKSMGSFPEVLFQERLVCGLNLDKPADMLVVFFPGADGMLKFAQTRNDVM